MYEKLRCRTVPFQLGRHVLFSKAQLQNDKQRKSNNEIPLTLRIVLENQSCYTRHTKL